MIEYFIKYHNKILLLLLEHLQIVALTLLISLLIAMPLGFWISRSKRLSSAVMAVLGVIYSVPSLALFALLIPLLGLGKTTAIFVLVAYNQYILVRNILAGFRSVDPSILEAGRGMGLSLPQLFFKIQLPLAMPVILGGIRIATVSTIGIATIAAVINAGGLGVILFDGLRMSHMPKILWGTIMASGLAYGANQLLLAFEKKSAFKARGESGRSKQSELTDPTVAR